MRTLMRHLHAGSVGDVTVCESCQQGCTPSCEAWARLDRDRTRALSAAPAR